ncbi:expressed unknown protein [Seminavis robusta]|uniref:Uncharacterized protein n=1 Tax=Seminavis robusta TaxID=568900 RepID=A0A9N8DTG1_9STRA|nr:expressed unknown protein [Seminavis robusta]|eukprot:Sro238_g095550.1 n/a (604) ;mRNA; f:35825-37636
MDSSYHHTGCDLSRSSHERLADYSKRRAASDGSTICIAQTAMGLLDDDDPFENLKSFPLSRPCDSREKKLGVALSTAEFLLSLPIEISREPVVSGVPSSANLSNASLNTSKKIFCMSPHKPDGKLSCSDRLRLSMTSVLTEDTMSELNLVPPAAQQPISSNTDSCGERTEEAGGSVTINFSLRRTTDKKKECKRGPLRKQHSSSEWLHHSLQCLMIDGSIESQEGGSNRRHPPQRSCSSVSLPNSRVLRPQAEDSRQVLNGTKGLLKEKMASGLPNEKATNSTSRKSLSGRSQLPSKSQSLRIRRGLSPVRTASRKWSSQTSLESLLKTAKERSNAKASSNFKAASDHGTTPRSPKTKTTVLLTRLHASTNSLLNAKNHSLLSDSMKAPTLTRKTSGAGNMRGRTLSPPPRKSHTGKIQATPAVDPRKALAREASTSKLATLAMLNRSSSSFRNFPDDAALSRIQQDVPTSERKKSARRRMSVSPVRGRPQKVSSARVTPKRDKSLHPLDSASNHELRTPLKKARFGSHNNLSAMVAMGPPLPLTNQGATTRRPTLARSSSSKRDLQQMSRVQHRRYVGEALQSSNLDSSAHSFVTGSRIVRY